jgi:SAM-dependent methyltransferase
MAGLDLDEAALALARQRAEEARVDIQFAQAEMREIPFRDELDAVINIFSSFGFYDTDEEDAEVLAAVSQALKKGGRLLIDAVNRERILAQYRPTESTEEPDGSQVTTKRELDLMTSRHRVTDVILRPDGREQRRWHQYRFYTLTEMARNLRTVGLETRQVWGDFDGSPYGLESRRMILLAQKQAAK